MICRKCGFELPKGTSYCTECGTKVVEDDIISTNTVNGHETVSTDATSSADNASCATPYNTETATSSTGAYDNSVETDSTAFPTGAGSTLNGAGVPPIYSSNAGAGVNRNYSVPGANVPPPYSYFAGGANRGYNPGVNNAGGYSAGGYSAGGYNAGGYNAGGYTPGGYSPNFYQNSSERIPTVKDYLIWTLVYPLLCLIPGFGSIIYLVFCFKFAFDNTYRARANFFKALLISSAIGLVVALVFFLLFFVVIGFSAETMFPEVFEEFQEGYNYMRVLLGK